MGHVHLYENYNPDNLFLGIVACMQARDTPILEVGDTVEHGGVRYEALPTLVGSILAVERDRSSAQVAIRGALEPGLNTANELAGASAGSA